MLQPNSLYYQTTGGNTMAIEISTKKAIDKIQQPLQKFQIRRNKRKPVKYD